MLEKNHYLIILCGGSGPRLWPLSRISHPKQLLKIFNNQSLIENTVSRCRQLTDSKKIYITTTKNLRHKLKFPNVLVEPKRQNTTMAVLLAISKIHSLDKDAITTFMPSDHYIDDINKLEHCLKLSYDIALKNKIALIGIKPSFTNVSYGYIASDKSHFVEKPPLAKAKELIEKDYYWNTDINTFKPETFINELRLHCPEYIKKSLNQLYKKSPNLNVANSILEKSKNLTLIKANFAWSDVGEWKTIYQHLPKDQNGHVILNNTQYISQNSKNCLLGTSKNKLIGIVGLEDITIIDTPDALLICKTPDSYEVRSLVATMMESPKTKKYFK